MLHVLVNNAGIGSTRGSDGEPVTMEHLTEEQWDRVMAVNAKGVFLGTKYAIPAMRQAGGGSIINISSIAGSSEDTPRPTALPRGRCVC